ncbi:MAG: DUF3852 domain-containing protein [Clostridia bacterium]|nr:DUF3852 domain-containing protein [Clostridia bacterium]
MLFIAVALLIKKYRKRKNKNQKGDTCAAKGQIKQVVNNVIFPIIDLILAVLFFVKVATAYLDYRKHGQFEWTAPAILLATLIFSLTCPLYIWNILGM